METRIYEQTILRVNNCLCITREWDTVREKSVNLMYTLVFWRTRIPRQLWYLSIRSYFSVCHLYLYHLRCGTILSSLNVKKSFYQSHPEHFHYKLVPELPPLSPSFGTLIDFLFARSVSLVGHFSGAPSSHGIRIDVPTDTLPLSSWTFSYSLSITSPSSVWNIRKWLTLPLGTVPQLDFFLDWTQNFPSDNDDIPLT